MKNRIKTYLYFSTLFISFLYFPSCTSTSPSDVKAQLETLRKEQNNITEKIKKLELLDTAARRADSMLINYKQVAISPVTITDFQHSIEVQGKVETDQNIQVNPKTMGIVTKILVAEGQKVHKGQLLAIIDHQVLDGSLAQLQSQYSLATILYQKQKNLWDQQIGSEVQYLQAKNNKDNLEKNIAIARDQVSQANIVAPISGVVDQVYARLGETASMGAPQFRIVNTDVLKIQGGLGENYSNQVGLGYPLSVEFPDAGKTIHTKVSFISKVIDPVTRTFLVQAKLSNEPNIRPNMVAILKIQDYHNPNAMVIPINMVQKSEEGSFVYVAIKGSDAKHGMAKRKMIKTGLIQDDKVEVKSGLDKEDILITLGYQGLSEGALITY